MRALRRQADCCMCLAYRQGPIEGGLPPSTQAGILYYEPHL